MDRTVSDAPGLPLTMEYILIKVRMFVDLRTVADGLAGYLSTWKEKPGKEKTMGPEVDM